MLQGIIMKTPNRKAAIRILILSAILPLTVSTSLIAYFLIDRELTIRDGINHNLAIQTASKDILIDNLSMQLLNLDSDYIQALNETTSCGRELALEKEYAAQLAEVIGSDKNCPEQPSFLLTAGRIASAHEYQLSIYDCKDFSSDLRNAYLDEGWSSHTMVVKPKGQNMRHAITILHIPIEAITGRIILPSEYPAYNIDKDTL
jgi:hypothetical protein